MVLLSVVTALVFANGTKEAAESSTQQPIKLKWAHVYETSTPYHKWALWAAEEINKRTDDRYEIEVFPSSLLGKESDINQGLNLGTVDIIYTGCSMAGKIYGPISMLDSAPFMFNNYEHFLNVAQSDFFTELADGYEKASGGSHPLALIYYGVRCITSNKPIYAPADMKGLKIREPNAPIFLMFPKAVGANPAPIALSEVYLALQQGVVDAQENPLPTIFSNKFHEVQKYITLSNHATAGIITIVAPKIWNKLSADDQAIFTTVAKEAAINCSNDVRQSEQDLISYFREQGVVVNEIDRQPFIDIMAPLLKGSNMAWTVDQFNKLQSLDVKTK